MKLSRVRITNFQSIRDSTEFEIGDVTCLVGKNEAGKTALLKALYRLNPIRPSDPGFDATGDYPRRHLVDYEQGLAATTRAPAQVVEAGYALDANDIDAITSKYGENCLTNCEAAVVLRKGYSNETTYSGLSVNEEAALSHLVANADLPSSLKDTLRTRKTVSGAIEALQGADGTDASKQLLGRLKSPTERSRAGSTTP